MSAVPSPEANTAPANGVRPLRKGSLGLWHAIIISVGVMSPAASIFFNTIPQAKYAGAAIPLCYAVGFIVALLVANPYSELAREMPSSGSAYTFVSEGIGARWGFLTGWVGLIAIGLGAPFTFMMMSANLQTLMSRWFGFNLHWGFYLIIITAIVFTLSVIGARESLRVDLIFLTFELGVCLLLAGVIIWRASATNTLTAAPFTPAVVPPGGDLIVGIVLGVLSFIGFETATTLGEETNNPHRNIPRAVYASMIVIGVFYVIMAYGATIGYPGAITTGYGNDPAPFDTIARHVGGPVFAAFIDLVGLFSFFSASLAIVNGGSRILYAVARDNLLPRWLAWTHPQRHTPAGAITLLCALGLVIGLGAGLALTPLGAYTFLSLLDAVFILIIYTLVCVACILYFTRKRREQFNALRHGILPALGALITALIFVAVIIPSPGAGVLNYAPVVVAVWLALGLVAIFALRKQFGLIKTPGVVITEQTPPQSEPSALAAPTEAHVDKMAEAQD
ncbi:MAG TPA: APC family permease [Ktedonobacterales bacterium]|nr:APC family permease [Ktedonobacterales bacterium]